MTSIPLWEDSGAHSRVKKCFERDPVLDVCVRGPIMDQSLMFVVNNSIKQPSLDTQTSRLSRSRPFEVSSRVPYYRLRPPPLFDFTLWAWCTAFCHKACGNNESSCCTIIVVVVVVAEVASIVVVVVVVAVVVIIVVVAVLVSRCK